MKMKKIISTLLAVLMLVSGLVVTVGAEGEATSTPEYTYNTTNAKQTMNYLKGETIPADKDSQAVKISSAEEKIAMMDLRLEKDGYRMYVDAYSGEIATQCIATGEILFTNPYTVCDPIPSSGKEAHDTIKAKLLSQLIIKYTDIATGQTSEFFSYTESAERGQIDVKNIKNGIRVEYTIGREEARMLVPLCIEKSDFETKILNVLEANAPNFDFGKVKSYYSLKDLDAAINDEARKAMEQEFPITKKMDVYIFDTSAASQEKGKVEEIIKEYAPNYSYEDLDEDHLKTEYQSQDENPPLFKMALEYTLDKYGVSVRLPANGIRFNESLYQLYSVEILPYMGAGKNPNSGSTFFPDGSGTIFDFEKLQDLGITTTVTGKVYGQDYAYHEISGTHQEIIRYPVFGITETEEFVKKSESAGDSEDGETEAQALEEEKTYKDRGFIAIVEEGDALMEISAYHAISTDPYNTVKMVVYPRPQDTYNIADAISVGSNDTWTVVSSRKYTGSYRVRYIMLTDPDVAPDDGKDYYECSYVGMAKAYREYLESKGILTRLTEDDVKEDIPLYIETFGAVETTKKILSIPVSTMAPLTSFENIKEMYTDFSEEGVKNINFILTGYTKGGLSNPKAPYNLKWDSSVGGKSGFEDLLEFAGENDFGIFPDFDFVFVSGNSMFDGLSLKDHAVKTIDNRYTSKRVYSATKQTYVSYFELAISPAYFDHFYTKLTKNYLKYDPMGISVSTLGSYLNSDFDEDEPYNREDAKEFTVNAFDYLDENYGKVMTSGGNYYSWKYVDYITDVALDSSRYAQAAASIPFLGMVLHGYVEIAGTPINMEGNIDYALLKAIENGASLNFILSFQNTDLLKNSVTLSQYYSVRYDIWFNDVVSIYKELNELLKDLQTSTIVDHYYIEGERVPDDDEILADAQNAVDSAIKLENDLIEAETKEEIDKLLEARKGIKTKLQKELPENYASIEGNVANLDSFDIDEVKVAYTEKSDAYNSAVDARREAHAKVAGLSAELKALESAATPDQTKITEKKAELATAETALTNAEADEKTALAEFEDVCGKLEERLNEIYNAANGVAAAAKATMDAYEKAIEYFNYFKANSGYVDDPADPDDLISRLEKQLTEEVTLSDGTTVLLPIDIYNKAVAEHDSAKAKADAAYNSVKDLAGIEIEEYVVNYGEEELPEEEPEDEDTFSRYDSDTNKIARVEYENGTVFILNFNNYDVTTVIDNVVYTIPTYGYVVFKK